MPELTASFAALDKALQDVQSKNVALTAAKKAYDDAASAYNKSVEAASAIRDQLNEMMAPIIGTSDNNRIRVSR